MKSVAVLLAVLGLLVAGCTGVPSDSAPTVIRTVPIGGQDVKAAATTPAPGLLPNTLVADFLDANALDASQQTSPRGFLSATARNNWTDTVVTVVDNPVVGFYDSRNDTVKVRGRELGTLNSSGVYTPTLLGASATPETFVYGVKPVDGQYRITSLRNGLLLSESDFLSYYTQRSVYYFDLAHHYLVPDPRWSSLTDPTQLADFLMTGLTTDPSTDIAGVVSTDTLPPRATTAGRINVTIGSTTKVEIPGASLLSAVGRNRLAEVVAATLGDVVRSSDIVITDSGKPVTVPAVHGTHFTESDFSARTAPPQPPPDVYYLRSGKVYGQDGARLRGAVNNGHFFLLSVAVTQDKAQGTNAIAATAGTATKSQLLVGTQSEGLRETPVQGLLTRPAFAPGRSEVWVGDGQSVYAVTVDNQNRSQRVQRVGLPSGAGSGRVVALRLSPDGSRLALVIQGPGGAQQLFVGAVVRSAGQISVGPLQLVSPTGVVIDDVAWVEPLKLLAIGYNASTKEQNVYALGSDGSGFTAEGIGNLPGTPTTLAVAVRQPAWVTAGKAVWTQSFGNEWLSPGPGTRTEGYGAVYLE